MVRKELCLGHSDTIIAGGAESMSHGTDEGHVIRPNAKLVQKQHQNIIWAWVIQQKK